MFFGVLVILTNRGFRPEGTDIEPVGFLVVLGGLGLTSARRALANQRKLIDVEQELATARRIQTAIIPHAPPVLSSLQIATHYQPMTSVAGDFYDFLQASDHRLTILVADVSGHGVPAALVASMLKVCFAAQQDQADNPAAILAGLSLMLRGSLGGQYITAACAAVDTEAGTVIYAGAGHPPSLLLRGGSGEIVQLAENGLFIGPFPNAAYSNISVPFRRGDTLLLYTDGITEAVGSDGQEFGRERLEHFLRTTQNASPSAVVKQLFQQISTPTQQDDLTVVLAQFT
jgi:sigma-B regulation protein RsbU (phosphoserine phosphatase)